MRQSLSGALQVTELAMRFATRFILGHPTSHELAHSHLEVELELGDHVAFDPAHCYDSPRHVNGCRHR